MPQFTPGPWAVREDYFIGRPGKTHPLAEVRCGDVPAADVEQHRANARLIAAAPELYEALTGLHSHCLNPRESDYFAVINAALSALLKATGGAR